MSITIEELQGRVRPQMNGERRVVEFGISLSRQVNQKHGHRYGPSNRVAMARVYCEDRRREITTDTLATHFMWPRPITAKVLSRLAEHGHIRRSRTERNQRNIALFVWEWIG